MSTLTKTGLALLVVAIGLTSAPVKSTDRKVDHAMACVPLSPNTSFADLYYRPVGLKNIRATTEYVVCPLSVDADSVSYWTATNGATGSVAVTFHSPIAADVLCEVSVGSNLDGTKATFSGSYTFTAGEVANVNISGIHGDAVTTNFMANYPVSLYCTMPANSSILRIRLEEAVVDTDDTTL